MSSYCHNTEKQLARVLPLDLPLLVSIEGIFNMNNMIFTTRHVGFF